MTLKVSKRMLKGIVKECLVELLAEGLGGDLSEAVARRSGALIVDDDEPAPVRQHLPASRAVVHEQRRPRHDPRLDARVSAPSPIDQAIRETSRGDSVLASLLADTAKTTLPSMLSGDRALQGGGFGGVEQITHSPEETFGKETASKWADLAFAPRRPGMRPPPDMGDDAPNS